MLHYGTKCQLYDTGCTSCKNRSKDHLRVPEINASIAGYLTKQKGSKKPRCDCQSLTMPLLQRVHLLRSFSTASCENYTCNYCLELTSCYHYSDYTVKEKISISHELHTVRSADYNNLGPCAMRCLATSKLQYWEGWQMLTNQ